MVSPSSRSICQRSSLCWVLSTLSPVAIVKSMRRPVTGPRPTRFIARTIESLTCADSISCARYELSNGSTPANGESGSL